jgi:hypothetical protein
LEYLQFGLYTTYGLIIVNSGQGKRGLININMTENTDTPTPHQEKMQYAFRQLLSENNPRAFFALTIGEDFMVNFASYGVDNDGILELLQYMIEYIKKEKAEDQYGRDEDTKIH